MNEWMQMTSVWAKKLKFPSQECSKAQGEEPENGLTLEAGYYDWGWITDSNWPQIEEKYDTKHMQEFTISQNLQEINFLDSNTTDQYPGP